MMLRILILLSVMVATSCSTTQYFTDSLPNTDTPTFNTYMVESDCDREINPINTIRVENAINIALRKRGYALSQNPDILIQSYMKNNERMWVETCNPFDRWQGGEYCRTKYVNYEEGTLIIDLIDAKTNKIFWHGAAYGNSFDYSKNMDARIQKIVDQLLNRFFKK